MRILLWTDQFWPMVGGIETLAADMLADLNRRGFDFLVVTSHGLVDLPDEEVFQGAAVRRFPFWTALRNRDPAAVARIRNDLSQLTKTFKPEVVHLFGLGTSLYFHSAVSPAGDLPTIVTLHNELPERAVQDRSSTIQRFLRSADRIVTCSETLLDQVLDRVPDLAGTAMAIPNAIDPPAASPSPPRFDPPVLMCIGRLTEQKGFDIAIRAQALLASRYPDARLVVIGDGEERAVLESLALELGIAEQVQFTGMISPRRVFDELERATVVLMPSRWEGLPIVGIQAAMMGRPIVGSAIRGLQEAVVDGSTGLLVKPADPQALADAVAELLEDPERTIRFGGAARSRALKQFSSERMMRQYDELYRQVGVSTASSAPGPG